MPLDGLTLGFVTGELDAKQPGGRIDRVTQPERDELILTIRNGGENHLLLLSASAESCARAHLTAQKKTGPLEPPSLCMLLRKHVTGGRVSAIRQIDCDRILEIEIEHYDELGDRATKRLVCEFMGKHSNLIFVGGDGRIIDSAPPRDGHDVLRPRGAARASLRAPAGPRQDPVRRSHARRPRLGDPRTRAARCGRRSRGRSAASRRRPRASWHTAQPAMRRCASTPAIPTPQPKPSRTRSPG